MTPTLHDSTGSVAQRASDSDREHAAQVVHVAAGAGMLTLEETEQRLSAVYASRFRHELVPLLADLPVDEIPPRPVRTLAGRARRRLDHGAALVMTLVLVALGWARGHRVAAVVLGVIIAALVVALVMVVGMEGPGGDDHGAGMMEP